MPSSGDSNESEATKSKAPEKAVSEPASKAGKASQTAEETPPEKLADRSRQWVDDWVNKLAGDGSELPSVTGLFGYVGRAPKPGRLRLYLDPHLLQCIEFDTRDIVHRVAAPREYSALGGSFVWVAAEGWANAAALWRQI